MTRPFPHTWSEPEDMVNKDRDQLVAIICQQRLLLDRRSQALTESFEKIASLTHEAISLRVRVESFEREELCCE